MKAQIENPNGFWYNFIRKLSVFYQKIISIYCITTLFSISYQMGFGVILLEKISILLENY